LLEIVGKSVHFNLIKIVLKFSVIWIIYSRSLEFGIMLLFGLEDFLWRLNFSGKGS